MDLENPWKYLLSHHLPKDYDRCLQVNFNDRKVRICSRCLGWYTSFLLFWVLLFLDLTFLLSYEMVVLYFFPAPAMIDWALHRFSLYNGSNLSRVSTGFLLGFTFAMLSYIFITNPLSVNFWVVSVLYTSIGVVIFKITSCSLSS